jgi:hypothetical protein
MRIRQWEVWKCQPEGFAKEHWFVIVSNQERLDSPRHTQINGLACFTPRGEPLKTDVRLNGADGFDTPMVCQCDLLYFLDKARVHSTRGPVSWERQLQLKSKIKDVLRL